MAIGVLRTRTNITYNQSAGTVQIEVIYEDGGLPNTILGSISNAVGSYNSVTYKEGDLLMFVKNSPSQINYQIDSNGNLIGFISTGDESKYSLDSDTGELLYEKDI